MKIKINRGMILLMLSIMLIIPMANAIGVAVSPPSLNFEVNLGESEKGAFFILNLDEESANYEVSAGECSGCNGWISFSENSVMVPAKENRKIEATINPKTWELGKSYDTIIYVRGVPKESAGGGASVGVAPGVGIKTKISIKEKKEQASPSPSPSSSASSQQTQNSGGGGASITSKTTKSSLSSAKPGIIDLAGSGNSEGKLIEEKEQDTESVSETGTLQLFSKILGAVIGPGGKIKWLGVAVFIIIIVGAFIVVMVVRKRRMKMRYGY